MASSIVSGLFAGRSGLNTHGQAMAVIGDNLANVNTIGHKAARVEFSDLIAGQAGGIGSGIGSDVKAVTQVFEQGT
ncbi:MAG: flagellar hook protein FlgE, partial [Candidatus Dadabacteria bacterium]